MSDSIRPNELFLTEPPPEAGSNLDLVGMLRRRKWLILFGGLLGLALGYLYAAKATPVYESNARILAVQKERLPLDGLEMTTIENSLSTQMLVLRSPRVVELAVQKADLGKLPSLAGKPNPAAAIISGLSVKPSATDAKVLELTYRCGVPDDCATILTAVVAAYQEFLGKAYVDVGQETVELITRAKDELHAKLEEKEKAYRQFQKESPLFWKGETGVNVYEQMLDEVRGKRSALLIGLQEKEAKVTSIETALKNGSSKAALRLMLGKTEVASGAMQSPQLQMLELQVQEKKLRLEGLGEEHPAVQAIRLQMEALNNYNAQISNSSISKDELDSKFIELYIASLRAEIQADQQELVQLEKFYEEQEKHAKQLRDIQIDAQSYQADIERTGALFETVMKRLEEVNLAVSHGGFKTETLAMPGRGYQVEPDEKRILTMAGVLGLMGGALLGFLVELADKTFRSPEEIRTKLGWPVLGHVPQIEASTLARISEDPDGQGVDSSIVAFHRPKSRIAEAYRVIRTALYFSTQGDAQKIIQVTSPDPGDGKSTLAANLAVSVAQTGKKTLLIDADFRRPRIHRLFSVADELGVTSLIAGKADLPDVVQSTQVENLFAIPCGPRPNNPSELLTSLRFQELLAMLREKFDFVIVDTPPLLAVSDPAVVVQRVDAVLLTIRIKKSARPAAIRAAEVLASLGANVAGIVVNGVAKGSDYGYSSNGYRDVYAHGSFGYGYGYGYMYGENEYSKYYTDADEPTQMSNSNSSSRLRNGR